MAVRALLCLITLAGIAFGQPSPEGDAGVTPFTAPPAASSVTPYVLPPQLQKPGAALPVVPPAPSLSMLVLVPQDVPHGQAIPYTIEVKNNSSADAGKVKIRMPIPAGTQVLVCEPKGEPTAGEMIWDLKSVPRGESRKIELKLKVIEAASELQVKAFVSYEFGQAVKTRLSAPKLKVSTELPKSAATSDETLPVRVRVTNDGRVPVEKVKLTETISKGFEFHRDSDGERTNDPAMRTWDLGTIPPGTGKTVEFRVMGKSAGDLLVRSNVDAGGSIQDSHEGKLRVQDAKLKIELRGDPQATDAVASFKATVRNDGTMALVNVKVLGSVPGDCRITTRTNGGQLTRDGVAWTIPKLAAGESVLLKWEMKSSAAGRKTVRAEATSDRGLHDSQEVQTLFAGAPALNWEQKFEQATVNVDKTGMFTIKLTNSGSETAKAAKVTVTLPAEVSFVQATPGFKQDGTKLVFDARDVKAGETEVYSITFRGEKTGQAYVQARLEAECLGSKPLNAEKYVQVTSR